MRAISTKEVLSLAGIALAAPILALAVVVGARAAAIPENDLLLLALSLGGAVLGGVNGFGRRATRPLPAPRSGNGPTSVRAAQPS
jgi:hypothetical protein